MSRGRVGRPWSLILPVTFAIGAAHSIINVLIVPGLLGSHAWIYTGAARVFLAGGDPWKSGPPAGQFAGPPPMLLPFIPFVGFPDSSLAVAGVVVAAAVLVWLLVKLQLPGYWIGFGPFVGVVVLGHVEVLVVALLLYGGRLGGLAAIVKPYTGFALLAQKRWDAILVALIALVVTAPFLPWRLFIEDRAFIAANVVGQYGGDSVFGNPVLMVVAVLALWSLGWKRALWLGAPLLWPYAQPGYKLMAVPLLTPVIAVFWALPVPGCALAGIVVQAVLERIDDRYALPAWLRVGIQPLTDLGASMWPERRRNPAGGAIPTAAPVGA